MDFLKWIHEVIDGVGGFHDYEKYELSIWGVDRDEEIARFIIRCLGNIKCEGSQEVLDAIIAYRKEE